MKYIIKVLVTCTIIFLFNGCSPEINKEKVPQPSPSSSANSSHKALTENTSSKQIEIPDKTSNGELPLERAHERITKKPFGLKISPSNSPIQPERFSGFHTGNDYEIFDDEKDKEIQVKAVCSGNILQKRDATGYGGILVQSCQLESQPITVIYGHLKLSSIKKDHDASLEKEEVFALLGDDKSKETDGERKHLHLGIKKDITNDVRGYVQTEEELSSWFDYGKVKDKLY